MIVMAIEECSFRAVGIWKLAEYHGISVVLSDLPAILPLSGNRAFSIAEDMRFVRTQVLNTAINRQNEMRKTE